MLPSDLLQPIRSAKDISPPLSRPLGGKVDLRAGGTVIGTGALQITTGHKKPFFWSE